MSKHTQIFKTTVVGVGPWCVEFPDGEIVTTRAEDRARLIAAAPEFHAAAEIAIVELEAVEREIGVPSKALPLLRAAISSAVGATPCELPRVPR